MSAYATIEDQPLVDLIKAGNHAAFAELVNRHTDAFFALAFRSLQNAHDAEDVVQNAFIKFWTRPSMWDPRQAKFTTWFYRVILNACHDLQRRSNRQVNMASEDFDLLESTLATSATVEAEQHLKWQRRYLEQAIRSLPTAQRDALNLAVYCEMPQREAAEILGISLKAFESLLVRAKRHLHQFVTAAIAKQARDDSLALASSK
ncbi:RNA polymerase sigma factor [Arenicella xantha]|uniref:RNA polymerase sigma-70 factor (ECF subfamily) n=1 Tax=Arenicella xantha TaxID=644221 RepID=A0A395JNR0_9GAMM|nr:sigma-70 family RNA polymerase sigma factor [Arenicella xantha]RBP53284.1 RNA polymerase sigma-70 factor (ECF subfamily) [Arenicella xantha]